MLSDGIVHEKLANHFANRVGSAVMLGFNKPKLDRPRLWKQHYVDSPKAPCDPNIANRRCARKPKAIGVSDDGISISVSLMRIVNHWSNE